MDTIVIGSGIAGLYYAYKNLRGKNFEIFEKNSYIGGRLKMSVFHEKPIVCGAGIGRWDKDILLKKLLEELEIPIEKTTSKKFHYPSQHTHVKFIEYIMDSIKKYHKKNPKYKSSFSEIIIKLFGSKILDKFTEVNGFSDFINEDFRETIWHYGNRLIIK